MGKKGETRLTPVSQRLRREMTKEERRLWYDYLKGLSVTVRRQKVLGKYIVDFYIPQFDLVIELDGSQHYEEPGREADRERDRYLADLGITVLRYSNLDINLNFRAVCDDIENHLRWTPSSVSLR